MRVFGHPLHVMLVHFPIALWPAHGGLHLAAGYLPSGVGPIAGFWLLTAGVALGWCAAAAGAVDLLQLWRQRDEKRFFAGIAHIAINGPVLLGFTCLLAAEYPNYPEIEHGAGFLSLEAALLVAMLAGNYFGASLTWGENLSTKDSPPLRRRK